MTTIEQLADRVAELEARLDTVQPLANPPVTIGELTDVPAPGSPLASAWANEISHRVMHRFTSEAARDAAYPAAVAGNGALAITLDTGAVWIVAGVKWVSIATRAYIGTTPSGDVGAGGSALIAQIVGLPLGVYLLNYRCLVSSVANMKGNLQVTGAAIAITNQFYVPVGGGHTLQMAVVCTVVASGTVNMTMVNTGTATLSTFNDPNYHQISAIRVV